MRYNKKNEITTKESNVKLLDKDIIIDMDKNNKIYLSSKGVYHAIDDRVEVNTLTFNFFKDIETYKEIEIQLNVPASCCGHIHYNIDKFKELTANDKFSMNQLLSCVHIQSDCCLMDFSMFRIFETTYTIDEEKEDANGKSILIHNGTIKLKKKES